MAEPEKITLLSESARHFEEIADIWRYEGLKRGVEHLLHSMGSNPVGYSVLEQMGGGVIDDPRLVTDLGGIRLDGPLGLGAGWDKTGRTALGWQGLGMRHLTAGGFPLYPQAGLPMPRLRTFDQRVGDHGTRISLNAFGFYSPGVETGRNNIRELRDSGRLRIPVWGQVTVNKEYYPKDRRKEIPGMLAQAIKVLEPVVDGISLGLSSPNTLDMREAQDEYDFVFGNLAAAREATDTSSRRLPLGYKGDGDGGERRLEIICRAVDQADADIIELCNSTSQSRIKARYGAEGLPGGLAGGDREFQDLAVSSVRYAYEAIGGKRAIHGMGGVGFGPEDEPLSGDAASAWQALRLLRAGASAVSLVSAVPSLKQHTARSVERGILAELDLHPQVTHLAQIIGTDTKRGPKMVLPDRHSA